MTIEVKLRFIPTGNTFTLPEEEARKIFETDRGNYEIIGEQNNIEIKKEKTTYEKVVNEVKPLSEYNYAELKAFAKENNIKASGNKEELLERCIEFTKQEADKQTGINTVVEVQNTDQTEENRSEKQLEMVEEKTEQDQIVDDNKLVQTTATNEKEETEKTEDKAEEVTNDN